MVPQRPPEKKKVNCCYPHLQRTDQRCCLRVGYVQNGIILHVYYSDIMCVEFVYLFMSSRVFVYHHSFDNAQASDWCVLLLVWLNNDAAVGWRLILTTTCLRHLNQWPSNLETNDTLLKY